MKQALLTLLTFFLFSSLLAQNNNILRGIITAKGENNRPLKGVAVTASGIANTIYTDDHGYFEITCKDMVAGDDVTLSIEKEGYVLLNGFEGSNRFNATIKRLPNQKNEILMQEKNKRESEVKRAEINIRNTINNNTQKQTEALDARLASMESKLQQSGVNEIERKSYLDSIQKLNIEKQNLLNDRDKALQLARETAEKLSAFDTEGASKELKQAQALFEAGKLDSAYVAINELTIQNKVKAAKRLEAKADSLKKSAIQDYFYKGQLAIANGKFDEAERLYTEGVRLDETDIDNLWTLAEFLYYQNKTQKAIDNLEKALSLVKSESSIASLNMNLGVVYKTLNKMPEAEKYYLKSLEIYERLSKTNPQQFEPDLAFILNNYGWFQVVNKKYEKAQSLLSRALAIRQKEMENGQTHFVQEYNRVFMNLGKLRDSFEVIKNYAAMVTIQTERAKSKEILRGIFKSGDAIAANEYGSLSWWALFSKDYALAEKAALRCLELDKTQEYVFTNLGHSQLLRGQYTQAMTTYEKLKGKKDGEGTDYKQVLIKDLNDLEAEGITHPDCAKARAAIEKW